MEPSQCLQSKHQFLNHLLLRQCNMKIVACCIVFHTELIKFLTIVRRWILLDNRLIVAYLWRWSFVAESVSFRKALARESKRISSFDESQKFALISLVMLMFRACCFSTVS